MVQLRAVCWTGVGDEEARAVRAVRAKREVRCIVVIFFLPLYSKRRVRAV